jgi:hypothetical protein
MTMKLLYIGTHFCPPESLSRLFLLGTELCFLDRPSVTFDSWGTIGHDSFMRRVSFGDAPIKVSVITPPGGRVDELYKTYIEADIQNHEFVATVLEGLRSDQAFAERLLQPAGNYGEGLTGVDVRRLLISDPGLHQAAFALAQGEPTLMYKAHLHEGRAAILRTLLVDVSIQITSAIVIADEIDALPVADDETLPKLLYWGIPAIAPYLGFQFARSVIPDQALRQIDFKGIFDYRRKSKDLYDAWNEEISGAAAKIADADLTRPNDAVQKIIATELKPKLREFENEMASIRDSLFGGIIKDVTAWELPTLSVSYVANLGYAGALAMFAAGVRATVPHLVDFVKGRREAKRKHAFRFYLV